MRSVYDIIFEKIIKNLDIRVIKEINIEIIFLKKCVNYSNNGCTKSSSNRRENYIRIYNACCAVKLGRIVYTK